MKPQLFICAQSHSFEKSMKFQVGPEAPKIVYVGAPDYSMVQDLYLDLGQDLGQDLGIWVWTSS